MIIMRWRFNDRGKATTGMGSAVYIAAQLTYSDRGGKSTDMGFRNQAGTGQPICFVLGEFSHLGKGLFFFLFFLNDPKSPDYGEKSF